MTQIMPYIVTGIDREGPWLITCDHARNHVPVEINGGDLGLPANEMHRHIAFDIGAEGLSLAIGSLLNAPVLCSNFSRLVIDPNRGEDDPTLLMKVYDGTLIPANRYADSSERERRLRAYHRPYHQAYSKLAIPERAIVAIHSFTPQLKGRPKRPWEIGILFAKDRRLSDPTIAGIQKRGDITVGINEPYNGHLPGDSVDKHALKQGHLNILIEVRNDLIITHEGQKNWANLLAPILQDSLTAIQTTSEGQQNGCTN